MNLYDNKNTVKLIIVGFAFTIGLASIIYTNGLVKQLAQREAQQITLLSKAQQLVSVTTGEAQSFLFEDIIEKNTTVPVILVNEEGKIIDNRNIKIPPKFNEEQEEALLRKELKIMRSQHQPLPVQITEDWTQYIYYKNSSLITQLQYYPIIQMLAISLLGLLAYIIFSVSRRSEQNRVWVGLAKETAHQLGTPISALMAWVEYFRTDPEFDQDIADEMDKDIRRLEMITARFSNIGSEPTMKVADVGNIAEGIVSYLQKRVSSKVSIRVIPRFGQDLSAMVNIPLFEWVIENLCKNAVDAMSGSGKIEIYIKNANDNTKVILDVNDTGKGIAPSKIKTVFKPGYTTKKRGWGLGLTLVKRIVEEYHKGFIHVRKSEVGVGTSFRIIIPKSQGKGAKLEKPRQSPVFEAE